jgi:hypothetical protein
MLSGFLDMMVDMSKHLTYNTVLLMNPKYGSQGSDRRAQIQKSTFVLIYFTRKTIKE